MRTLILLIFISSLLFATQWEISYDCGLPTDEGSYGLGSVYGVNQLLRVKFTAPISAYGVPLYKVRLKTKYSGLGSVVTLYFIVREINSGQSFQSGNYILLNQNAWVDFNLSGLLYNANSSDFYIEAHPTSGFSGVSACQHAPIDQRSQWYTQNAGVWTDITNYDLSIRAILDDSIIGVCPTSLGQLRALFK
jgi:hypothetical protein